MRKKAVLLPILIVITVLFLSGFGKFTKLFDQKVVSTAEVLSEQIKANPKDVWLPDLNKKINLTFPPPVLEASAALSFDYTNERFIYTNNPDLRQSGASTMKIMTAIVALENKKLDDVLTVSEYASSAEPNSMGLYQGEKLTLKQLLYGLMLVSGNDAARTIAEGVAGSEENFVKRMNQKAKELGLKNTHFANSSGLDSDKDNEDQYTSAYDLLVMSHYALEKFEVFREIAATRHKIIPNTVNERENHKFYELFNSSPVIDYPGYKGIKPGFTPLAKKCLVTLVEKDGKEVLTVVLGTDDRKGDTEVLLDYSFKILN